MFALIAHSLLMTLLVKEKGKEETLLKMPVFARIQPVDTHLSCISLFASL